MVGQDGSSDPFGPGTTDVRTLRRQHREAHAVLDHQVAMLDDVDDAALRTARMAALLLTLVLTGAGLSGVQPFWNRATSAGALGLGCTFFLGILVHGSSTVYLGPGPGSFDDVTTRPYSEREWLYRLLEEYADWITTKRQVVNRSGLYLEVTQMVLLVSVILLGVGATRLTGGDILPLG